MVIFRDKRTGRFASPRSWRRSHGHSGKYVRQTVKGNRKPRRKAKVPVAAPPLAGTGGAESSRGVPAEFLEIAEDFFESGYEAPEEEEYA